MSVTPEDIAVELGRPIPLDAPVAAQWQKWIDRALWLIGNRLGDTSALDQVSLDNVVTMAVARHVRNPDDATQVTHAIDDGSVSRTYRSGSGEVTILDEWWAILDPDIADSGAFSVTPYFAPDWPVP